MKRNKRTHAAREYFRAFYEKNHIRYWAAMVLSVLSIGVNLFVTWLLGAMIDIIAAGEVDRLMGMLWVWIGLAVFTVTVDTASCWAKLGFVRRALVQYKALAFRRLSEKSISAFSREYELNDPEYATPLGIAVSAGLGLISDSYRILLNGKPAKLFRSGALTVLDLLMMNGYTSSDLVGRTGRTLSVTVDGQRLTCLVETHLSGGCHLLLHGCSIGGRKGHHLAAAHDGGQHAVGRGGDEDEAGARRGLFQRFEQGVCRQSAQTLGLLDHKDLGTSAYRASIGGGDDGLDLL